MKLSGLNLLYLIPEKFKENLISYYSNNSVNKNTPFFQFIKIENIQANHDMIFEIGWHGQA